MKPNIAVFAASAILVLLPSCGSAAPGSSAVALIDCDNFYVSCERAFDPALASVPSVVGGDYESRHC